MTALTATIKPLQNVQALEASWRALETSVERPFFLSWEWAAAAIEAAQSHNKKENALYVAEIKSYCGQLLGLGLLGGVTERRHGFLRMRQLRLNEVGPCAGRTVPIEYNTFLTAPEHEGPAWEAVLRALRCGDAPPWDEIIVTNALVPTKSHTESGGRLLHLRAESTSGFVNLNALRQNNVDNLDGYLAGLGRNTRSQIRRSIRLYEEKGPVTLERASTPGEAKEYLLALGELHEAKWRARGAAGALSNKFFWDFHNGLIDRCFETGGVELLRASSGDDAFGWLYNFVDRGHVLFNLGGFKPVSDNRFKPGLVTQALAIGDHLSAGKDIYDFMAGADRYKLNLGIRGPDMVTFAIQRRTPIIIAENAARWGKNLLARHTGGRRSNEVAASN